MFPFVKEAFTQNGFRAYVNTLHWTRWRPSKIVWHNTAAPSLAQWIKSADQDRAMGLIPGITRIKNLEAFFKDNQGWNGGPHLFVANDVIWVANPLTERGTHSPSFNSTAIGIEMVGDYDIENDDAGEGLKVKRNTIFATAVLCSALGLDPNKDILLHKQDPRTTHDCPGKNIAVDKLRMIDEVLALMGGGEHDPEEVAKVIAGEEPTPAVGGHKGVVTQNELNFRRGPGVDSESTGKLPNGTELTILAEAKNGIDRWLKVKTPGGYIGWVSGRFVKEERRI
jgi:hypothetical protein